MNDKLIIAGREFSSRLFIGTGKFPSNKVMRQAIAASGAEMVTTAFKRLNTQDSGSENILDFIPKECMLLPNTSGVRDAEEAVFAAKMNRAALGTEWLKLEIHPDPKYLLPDTRETLKATEELVKLGFKVLPYVQADPVACKQLEELGAVTVMPLAAPIGTNKGIKNEEMLQIIIEQSNVPVVIDAGIGAPSHAARAMELGADACLINTAIAIAGDPVQMAEAFAFSIRAGRQAYRAGLGTTSLTAVATSPLTAFLEEMEN
ncbi:MAG: thiazole synthase [Bacteroidales bacterium]|nr:thiazole synthase [Bacteroidales bacterium]